MDVSRGVSSAEGRVLLPFDLSEVVDNLRHERYPEAQRAIEHISVVQPVARRLLLLPARSCPSA